MGKTIRGFDGDMPNKRIKAMRPDLRHSIAGDSYSKKHKRDISLGTDFSRQFINIVAIRKMSPGQKERVLIKSLGDDRSKWKNVPAIYELGRLYLSQNRHDEAIGYFEMILRIKPGDVLSLDSLGQIAISEGNFNTAKGYFIKMKEFAPLDTYATNGLGKVALAINDFLNARFWFNETLKNDPLNIPAKFGLGQAYLSIGEHLEAEKLFKEIVALNANDEQAIFGLGTLALTRGETDLAREHFGTLLKIDPNNKFAKYGMGNLSLMLNDLETAANWYKSLLESDGTNQYALKGMASIFMAKGRTEDARYLFEKVKGFKIRTSFSFKDYRFSKHSQERCSLFNIDHQELLSGKLHIVVDFGEISEAYITHNKNVYKLIVSSEHRTVITVIKICMSLEELDIKKDISTPIEKSGSTSIFKIKAVKYVKAFFERIKKTVEWLKGKRKDKGK